MTDIKQQAIAYAERTMLEQAGHTVFMEAFTGMVRVKASLGDKLLDLMMMRKPSEYRWAEKAQLLPEAKGKTIRFNRPESRRQAIKT